MTSTAVLEQPTVTSIEEVSALPNKFMYPEFAGFRGEQLMHDICQVMLPAALFRTWQIFERKHAYDNDCFLAVTMVAKAARRTLRTIERNLATLASRGLMAFRPEIKFFRGPDGTMRKKVVMVKDFSGLYALAHEYYEWQQSDDYQAPDWEGIELIRHDPRLVAKLCRFEDYRRALDTQHEPAFLRVQADPRFAASQEEDAEDPDQHHAKDAEVDTSSQNATLLPSKRLSNVASKVSKERINEKAYKDSQSGDSSDSDKTFEQEEAGATSHTYSQKQASVAADYTKRGQEQHPHHESKTNPVSPSPKNIPPGAGKTHKSEEEHPDVQRARSVMVAAGITPGRYARRQAEELPPPPKHPLARSFVHEVAGLFGDLNEKGSKTGIERSIETFDLEPAEVLLCLVRAYVVARDTKVEKIRHHRSDGMANRMPLFCTMFKRFAQALGPGSTWQYTWEQMLEDIAADDRLNLWLSEHQAELTGEVNDQAETSQSLPTIVEEEASEASEESDQESLEKSEEGTDQAEAQDDDQTGWSDRVEAYRQGGRLMQAIVDANYVNVAVALREAEERFYVVFKVQGEGELVLSTEEEIAYLIEQAQLGQL